MALSVLKRDFTPPAPNRRHGTLFFGTITTALGEGLVDPSDVEDDCSDDIEVFYNQQRMGSSIGYKRPAE